MAELMDTLVPSSVTPAPLEGVGAPAAVDHADSPEAKNQAIVDRFKSRLAAAQTQNLQFRGDWKTSIEDRVGRVGSWWSAGVPMSDNAARTSINPDWALTKTKVSNLFSQVPEVQVTHEADGYAAAAPPFSKSLNFELGPKRANIGVAIEETLNDVVNAAGVGAIVVEYQARFEDVMVPKQDPKTLGILQKFGQFLNGPEMINQPRVVSDKFSARRISPKNLRWPDEFIGSNFDDGDWVGYKGFLSWGDAKNDLQLTEADKEQVIGACDNQSTQDLRVGAERTPPPSDTQLVSFTTVFYWRHRVDPECKSFQEIWKLVMVDGKDQPAIHEPWKGQKWNEQTKQYAGAVKFPVRVLTLTYITDNPIPPSDSSAGRSQVYDLRRSRDQMFANRDRSIPIRWVDSNRTDPMILDNLMKGTFQGFIPTMGDGSRTIGEVARASYPAEDFAFDNATKADLADTWRIGANQMGTVAKGDPTKAEVEIAQANFATGIGQERAKVASFFVSIAEVMAGLMALYSQFPVLTPEQRQQMLTAWDCRTMPVAFSLKIWPDSTILLDSQAKIARNSQLINLLGKSGYIDPLPLIIETLELAGKDPSRIVKQPQPQQPEPPTLSYAFKGEDLTSPIVMAMLIKEGKAPSPQELEAAKLLLGAMQAPAAPQVAAVGPPQTPQGPDRIMDSNKGWTQVPKVAKRSREAGEAE